MRKSLLAVIALGGFFAIAGTGAKAAPAVAALHVAPAHDTITPVDYYWHRRHWHHRHWEHNRWRYYD